MNHAKAMPLFADLSLVDMKALYRISFRVDYQAGETLIEKGEPGRGLACMFQMMNEARIMVGMNGVATASVAYHEAVAYARERPQGRPLGAKDPAASPVAITAHADVRRMLLRQRAIVVGGLALLVRTSRYADLAHHGADADAALLLELLTPIAKTFPAERGFEANALAVQIHGGYGYSSEYPVEAWLREQKLNSIHEGTTGIHALDLLGRRAMAGGGAALAAWSRAIDRTCARAAADAAWAEDLGAARDLVLALTRDLAARGLTGDADGMLAHATDYLDLFATVAIAWQWLELAAAVTDRDPAHRAVTRASAAYWFATELPRIHHLAALCRSAERSFVDLDPAWL